MGRSIKTKPGEKYGRLTVTAIDSEYFIDGVHVICDCECGAKGVVVNNRNIRRGYTRSCGCLRAETSKINRWKNKQAVIRHSALL